MINQLNFLIRKFGARLQIIEIGPRGDVHFRIEGYSEFHLTIGGSLYEQTAPNTVSHTPRSDWLWGISVGKTRNDEGVLV